MTEQLYTGLPTLSLLPMNTTEFKVVGTYKIELPREGNYHKMQPEVFTEDHGDFKLLDNDVLYLPAITKILIATGKYPAMEGNQLFAPLSFIFKEDTVEVQGSVLEILSVEQRPDAKQTD